MILYQTKNGETTDKIEEAENFCRLSDDLYVEKRKPIDTRLIFEQRLTFADGLLLGIFGTGILAAIVYVLLHIAIR